MPVAVLAGGVELDVVMMRVLDRRDGEATGPQRRDQPLDQRGLAAALVADDGDDTHPYPAGEKPGAN